MFHPTLKKIIFGGYKQTLKWLDINKEDSKPEEIGRTEWAIFSIDVNKDGSKIYCKDELGKTVYIHRQEEGKWVQTKEKIDTAKDFAKLAVNPQTDEVVLGIHPTPQMLKE